MDDLLTTSTAQNITGHYRLQGDLEIDSLNVTGLLNNFNLDKLLSSVLQFDGSPVVIKSQLMFDVLNVSDHFLVNGSINGVGTDRIVLQDADQIFTAPQILVSPIFNRLDVNGNLRILNQTSRVNGIDLDIFDRRRVTLSTDQWIRGKWQLNSANVSSLTLKNLNGLTLEQWQSDFIRAHSPVPQIINAQTIDVNRLEVFGSVFTSSGLSGHNLTQLAETAGDIRQDIIFPSQVSFDQLEAEGMQMNGTFNNYSLQQLRKEAVVVGQAVKPISGVKRFKTLRIKGDVEADFINGRRLIESYLHVSANQTIDAPLHVDQITTADLNLLGEDSSLNGVPSGALLASQTLPFNIHRGNVIIERQISVSSLLIPSLQNEDWKSLISSLALLNQTNRFQGTVTFTNHLEVSHSFNIFRFYCGKSFKLFLKSRSLVR